MFKSIKGWWEKRSTGTISDPWTALLLGGYGPTSSGINVTPETAMRCSTVYGAVKVLSESVGLLPLHLYRRLPDGGKERATDHHVSPMLNSAANEWTPASEFQMVMTNLFCLHNRAYAYVGRDNDGRPVELIPLDPRAVTVKRNPLTLEPVYLVSTGGEQREYSRRDILHLRGIGTGLDDGDSPVTLGREAIGISMVMEQHAGGLFGRGAKVSGILKHAKTLTDQVAARLRASFEAVYGGGLNSGKTAILEEGMEFQQVQLSSVDAQFLDLRKFQVQEISRFWRVPLHLLNDMERATHNNAEEMGQQFLSYCLMPLLRMWQEAIHITLLTAEERKTLYCEFLVDDLARASLSQRFTAYSQAINGGVFNPNEVRAMENRSPYAGGETYMRPVNTAPAPAADGASSNTTQGDGNGGNA